MTTTNVPSIESFLIMKTSSRLSARKRSVFVTLENTTLRVFKNKPAHKSEKAKTSIDLKLASVKTPFESGRKFDRQFTVLSADNPTLRFKAKDKRSRDVWVSRLQDRIAAALSKTIISGMAKPQQTVIDYLRSIRGNKKCADCGEADPKWVSVNLGILICIDCAGVHRRLGTNTSRVRSIELDGLSESCLAVMGCIGNSLSNSIWEATAGRNKRSRRPLSDEARSEWIREKYEKRSFLPHFSTNRYRLVRLLDKAIFYSNTAQFLLCLAKAPTSIVNMPYSENDSRRPIHFAAGRGRLAYLQMLVWLNADTTMTNADGRNAYYYAISIGHLNCALFLLNNGCPAVTLK